jgi:predicted RNA-binding protein with RPS1 domain
MQYRIGQTVEGKVTGIQPYGAFVMLDRQTCGLIHISEISDGYVRDISRYVKVGDTITVKIIDFDAAANQARLSLKALHKTHSRGRRRPMNRKAELPPSHIGFSSIAGMMKQWVAEAEKGEKQV